MVERLYFDKGYDFKAFIHSFGNAARLARFPITIKPVDILDFRQVNRELAGCNVVVNCSRGGLPTMIKGVKNIINASKNNGIEKFIHISSIAIYGSNPPPNSKTEMASPDPGPNVYGMTKLKQDNLILKLHASGIPSIILCPSNIAGPYSPFVLGSAQKLLSNEIILVDGGKYPTNLIHVDNLVEAILKAVESSNGWGERYFINEIEETTWKEFYEELNEILCLNTKFQSVSRDEVLKKIKETKKNSRLSDNARILISREFRDTMSKFPIFKNLDDFACNMFFRLKSETQTKLRQKLSGPIIINKESPKISLNQPYIGVQTRQFYHSPQKIISKLNYTPFLNYQKRKETTESWFKFINLVK